MTGTRPRAASMVAVMTAPCSSWESVGLSPVVPTGTSPCVPLSICQSTRARNRSKSTMPPSKGVTNAVTDPWKIAILLIRSRLSLAPHRRRIRQSTSVPAVIAADSHSGKAFGRFHIGGGGTRRVGQGLARVARETFGISRGRAWEVVMVDDSLTIWRQGRLLARESRLMKSLRPFHITTRDAARLGLLLAGRGRSGALCADPARAIGETFGENRH